MLTELGHCVKGPLKPPVSPSTLVSGQNKLKASLLHLEFPLTVQCKHREAQEKKCQPALNKPARRAGDKEQAGGWWGLWLEGLKDLNRI